MKTTRFKILLLLVLIALTCSCGPNSQKLLVERINKASVLMKSINEEPKLAYKDTTIRMILVEKNVKWNKRAKGQGTFAFDEAMGMVIVKVEPINEGRQTHSFVITEVLPAKYSLFIDRQEQEIEEKFSKFEARVKGKFKSHNSSLNNALADLNTQRQRMKKSFSSFKEKISASNATVKYSWHVEGDNNPFTRRPGRVKGGLNVTLRKYEQPQAQKKLKRLESELDELMKFIGTID